MPQKISDILLSLFLVVDQFDMTSLELLFSGAAPLGAALSKQVGLCECMSCKNGAETFMLGDQETASEAEGQEPSQNSSGYVLRLHTIEQRIIWHDTGYGLTETSPTCHLVPIADGERKIGSIGVLLPNLEARLVVDGEGDGNIDAKPGQPGELWIRGPIIMKVRFPALPYFCNLQLTNVIHRVT